MDDFFSLQVFWGMHQRPQTSWRKVDHLFAVDLVESCTWAQTQLELSFFQAESVVRGKGVMWAHPFVYMLSIHWESIQCMLSIHWAEHLKKGLIRVIFACSNNWLVPEACSLGVLYVFGNTALTSHHSSYIPGEPVERYCQMQNSILHLGNVSSTPVPICTDVASENVPPAPTGEGSQGFAGIVIPTRLCIWTQNLP